ncbi:hypothetical protein TRVL_01487 [Trypanosoma vivax]|nr:hypothetical protein TRVL_01487 [Trypanosoma vivax]
MARSSAIETRLEKLLPSMEEYFTCGFLTREELHNVARQRAHWEYRLVAKPLLLLDVQNAVQYELGLEEKLRKYCTATKLVFRHRWAIVERIESIYRIGLRHIKDVDEWNVLRRELVQFLKEQNRHSSLSTLYGELMLRYPTRSELWVEAALYEGVEAGNSDNARALLQQAILTAGAQPEVWNAAVMVELHFVDRLLSKLLEEQKREEEEGGGERKQKRDVVKELRAESAGLAEVVVDLALVKAVMEEALESPAFGPTLLKLLVGSVACFCYARHILEVLVMSAAKMMLLCLSNGASGGTSSKRISTVHRWTDKGVHGLMRDFLMMDVIIVDRGVMSDVSLFLRSSGRRRTASRAERIVAHIKSLIAALTVMQMEESKFPVLRRLYGAAASVVESLMEGLQELGCINSVSAVCRQLLSRPRMKSSGVIDRECRDINIERILQCLWGETDVPQNEQGHVHKSAAARVTEAVLECAAEENFDCKQKKVRKRERSESHFHTWQSLWRFLLPADSAEVCSSAACGARQCTAADIDLLSHRTTRENTPDPEAAAQAVLRFLHEFQIVPASAGLDCVRELRFSSDTTPVAIWKVFLLLEERCGTCDVQPPTSAVTLSTTLSSDDECDEGFGRCFTEGAATPTRGLRDINVDTSYAAAGLSFLSSVTRDALQSAEAEVEWLCGCWALVMARVHTLTQVGTPTRADFIRHLRDGGPERAWVEGVRSILRTARICNPLPRQVFSDIAVPFFEALALEQRRLHEAIKGDISTARSKNSKHSVETAVQDARAAHMCVLTMYTQSPNPHRYAPLVESISGRGISRYASVAQANAADWVRLIVFERDVALDLRRAKEAAARARREALEPQQLLIMLNAQ